ncbi:MAG: cytochrome P450 [Mycobacteriaceae bacterium]|nr:cytochrome P450 [Mycobacteriaceae bacterium]
MARPTAITDGPSGMRAVRYWVQMFRDPLATYGALGRRYGDAIRIPLSRKHIFYLLSRPEYGEHVLVSHQDRYVKAFTYRPLKAFLGDGLLTAEGAVWQRHRRLVQPVFSHRHIQSFAPAIVEASRKRFASWAPGATVDVAAEMRTLTMDIIGRVLFGADLAGDAEPVGHAVTRLQSSMMIASIMPASLPPERVRKVAERVVPSVGRASETLESLVTRIIDDRIAAPHDKPKDLLDLLLAAGQDEQALRRDEIQDEVMTLVLAGHETTANALTWALTLLSRYPAARDRLADEVNEALGDGDPSDIDALPWTQAVINETMRLYPPAWTVERDAVVDDDIAGVAVTAGDTIAISPYLLHRNPEFWPNPEGFDPRRFLPDNCQSRPRYAFMPFGGGRRICVGAGLATLEATLALAVLTQTARVDLLPTAGVRARADVTLHPSGPVLANVTPAR